jgi:hypothetical protein
MTNARDGISSAAQQKKRAEPAFPHPVLPDSRLRNCQFIRGQYRPGKGEGIIPPVTGHTRYLHAGVSMLYLGRQGDSGMTIKRQFCEDLRGRSAVYPFNTGKFR